MLSDNLKNHAGSCVEITSKCILVESICILNVIYRETYLDRAKSNMMCLAFILSKKLQEIGPILPLEVCKFIKIILEESEPSNQAQLKNYLEKELGFIDILVNKLDQIDKF